MKIAVFCGSAPGTEPAFRNAARRLGERIGKGGHTLVYGGGDAGLMGILAEAAFKSGAHVIGVVPGNVGFISNRSQPYVSELICAKDMSERKQIMLDMADMFIALPGGVGTLDEMTEAITLTRIGLFHKDCIFLNEPFINRSSLNGSSLKRSSLNEPPLNEPSLNEPPLNEPSLNEPSLNEPFMNRDSINRQGFYEPQRQMFLQMVRAGFLEDAFFDYVKFETAETVKC